MTKHTPTPWVAEGDTIRLNNGSLSGFAIAQCNNSIEWDNDNAAFIAEACNMHDNLLVLCRALVDVIESELTPEAQAACPELIAARAIIKEVKE